MTDGDQPSLAELDAVLERAVERQVAEQRALRQALDQLRDAVESVDRGATAPAAAEVDLGAIDEGVRRAVEAAVAKLSGELRDVRGALDPQTELTSNVNQMVRSFREELKTLHSQISSVEGDVAGVGADIEGIAQALIDLNAGLRTWADDVDASVKSLRDTVDSIRELTQTRAVAEAAEVTEPPAPPADPEAEARIGRIEQQVKETAELSLYLTDQIEDLDRIIKSLGELPDKVEGAVTQAMRRAVTARTKLDQDVSTLLDDLTSALEEGTERLAEVLDSLDASGLRKLTLGNVELASQVASLHETVVARLGAAETEQRRAIEVLARAIDRWAKGQDPRALEGLTKGAVPRKRPSARTPRRTKDATKGSGPARGKRTRDPDATT